MAVDDEPGYRSRRRQWTRGEILDAAWEIARRDGIAMLSLREVAERVGLRTPSLYYYFPSKAALYDAMYAAAMEQFAEAVLASPVGTDPGQTLRNRARAFIATAMADPVRYELLFQRPVADFVPSSEHVQFALTVLDTTREIASAAGIAKDAAFDLFMATIRGLIATQLANDPAGDRWTGLVDMAIDIHTTGQRNQARSPRTRSRRPSDRHD